MGYRTRMRATAHLRIRHPLTPELEQAVKAQVAHDLAQREESQRRHRELDAIPTPFVPPSPLRRGPPPLNRIKGEIPIDVLLQRLKERSALGGFPVTPEELRRLATTVPPQPKVQGAFRTICMRPTPEAVTNLIMHWDLVQRVLAPGQASQGYCNVVYRDTAHTMTERVAWVVVDTYGTMRRTSAKQLAEKPIFGSDEMLCAAWLQPETLVDTAVRTSVRSWHLAGYSSEWAYESEGYDYTVPQRVMLWVSENSLGLGTSDEIDTCAAVVRIIPQL